LPPVRMTAYIDGSGYRLLQKSLVEDDPPTCARGALHRERFDEPFGHPLAGHLHEAELGDLEDLGAGLVAGQGGLEDTQHLLRRRPLFQVPSFQLSPLRVSHISHDTWLFPFDISSLWQVVSSTATREVIAETRCGGEAACPRCQDEGSRWHEPLSVRCLFCLTSFLGIELSGELSKERQKSVGPSQ